MFVLVLVLVHTQLCDHFQGDLGLQSETGGEFLPPSFRPGWPIPVGTSVLEGGILAKQARAIFSHFQGDLGLWSETGGEILPPSFRTGWPIPVGTFCFLPGILAKQARGI